jgi:hypothetical protein
VVRLVAAIPNIGWQMERDVGSDEVEVEFVSADSEWRIRARCRGGVLEPEVSD